MGTLFYGSSRLKIAFDDRVLAHLQIVIVSKLRRGESFALNWRDDPKIGDGRSAIWIAPSIELHFKYSGGHYPDINREWIESLSLSAASATGLQLHDEASLVNPPQG
jgi:hypothetical protein